ncbi:MAG: LD-carboxypeptidase [Pseudomonadota bacterium]
MKNWYYLKQGDIIDIVATTPGVKVATLKRDLTHLSSFVRNLGLEPRINFESILKGANFFEEAAQAVRQEELIKALKAKDSKAIWFIRGGYGTAQLLNQLSSVSPPENPKLLIGYSDINSLHLWVQKFWKWTGLHARVLYEYLETQDINDIESLKNIIFGKQESISFDNLVPLNKHAQVNQVIDSFIIGGTMQVLQSGIGLSWQFDAKDKILFFEEIFDRGVRLERTLNHFKELGLLKDARAIIFGDIICGKEIDGSETCNQAIKHFASKIDIPALHIPGIGHGALNHPLPLNTPSKLILKQNSAKLICSNGGKNV